MEDLFCKRVFSYVRMIELLIRSEIPEWADEIDYASLRRLPADFVDENLTHRSTDLVWGGRSLDGSAEFHLFLDVRDRPGRHMALQASVYMFPALLERQWHERALRRGDRKLGARSLVLHHGDRPWDAPTRLPQVLGDDAADVYKVVSPRLPEAPPPTPLDLPRMLLGLARVSTAEEMLTELPELQRVVGDCRDAGLDRFLADNVKALLWARRISGYPLKYADTLQEVAAVLEQGVEEV